MSIDEEKSLLENPGNADPVAPGAEALRPSAAIRLHPLAITGKRLISFFSLTEPLWALAVAFWVNLSYLLQMETGLIWLGLAILFIPFLSRLWRVTYCTPRKNSRI